VKYEVKKPGSLWRKISFFTSALFVACGFSPGGWKIRKLGRCQERLEGQPIVCVSTPLPCQRFACLDLRNRSIMYPLE